MNERFLHAIFCDDIRFEERNKISLMGIYYGSIVLDQVPIFLARFCVHANAITPVDQPFQELLFRLLLDGNTIQELRVQPENLRMEADPPGLSIPSRLAGFGGNLAVSPLFIDRPGELWIEAHTESEILKGPRLRVITN